MSQLTNLDGHEIKQKIRSMKHQQFPACVLFYSFVNIAFPAIDNCLRLIEQMVHVCAIKQLCVNRLYRNVID